MARGSISAMANPRGQALSCGRGPHFHDVGVTSWADATRTANWNPHLIAGVSGIVFIVGETLLGLSKQNRDEGARRER